MTTVAQKKDFSELLLERCIFRLETGLVRLLLCLRIRLEGLDLVDCSRLDLLELLTQLLNCLISSGYLRQEARRGRRSLRRVRVVGCFVPIEPAAPSQPSRP